MQNMISITDETEQELRELIKQFEIDTGEKSTIESMLRCVVKHT